MSVRALRARLEELGQSGMPLHRDQDPPHTYWSVPKGWLPDGVAIGKVDLAQLLRFIARSPRSPTRDALMRKLLRNDTSTSIALNAAPLAEQEPILAILEDARATRHAVHLLYTTAATGVDSWRHASVLHIEYVPRVRFVAFCHKARELRWFRASRVRQAVLAPSEAFMFAPEDDVVDFLARSIDGWVDDTSPRAVSFVVYGDDARWVPGNLPSADMTVETCQGGIRVTAVTSGLTVLARFVVGLGAAAVVETPELRERVEGLARGALSRAARTGGKGIVKAWGEPNSLDGPAGTAR